MPFFKSADEILDFAIEREEQASEFYTDLAGTAERPEMREVFEQFAREEDSHKQRLIKVKKGKALTFSQETIPDLKIAEYTVEVDPHKKLDYQDALLLAMKKEEAAHRLYNDLASHMAESNLRDTLLGLAQEEAKHKLRFETEYDEQYLPED